MSGRGPILLAGARGMLAWELCRVLVDSGRELILSDRMSPETITERDGDWLELDITQAEQVCAVIADIRPQWVVNCAAYTAVDLAESKTQDAHAVNVQGVENLALGCQEAGARLLHISTDYVFGGADGKCPRREPYREDDATDPCGAYGRTKWAGEEAARQILGAEALIVRTSWLHGLHGPSFLKTMLELARTKTKLSVVSDQFGCPTFTGWLAPTLGALIEHDARGIFHAAMSGVTTWADYAEEIFRQAGKAVDVVHVRTEEFPRPAPRPRFSALDTTKLQTFLGSSIPDWRTGVKQHLEQLQQGGVV